MPTFVKRGKRLTGENFQNEMATLPERAMFVLAVFITLVYITASLTGNFFFPP